MDHGEMTRRRERPWMIGAALAACLAPGLASATLGGTEQSVEVDRQHLRGSVTVSNEALYRVHELQLPSGTIVREFVAANGTVFAVAWRGPLLPDLRQTLGPYIGPYVAASKARVAGRHRVEINQKNLVVQSGGRMRAFAGRAYLPSAVPAGVSLEALH
jgi:hypothetical protein